MRPVLVVSNNINNKHSLTVTVLPITSNIGRVYPFDVFLLKGEGNLPKDSKVKTDQIRTIDKSRLTKEIGTVSEYIMNEAEQAIKVHLNLK